MQRPARIEKLLAEKAEKRLNTPRPREVIPYPPYVEIKEPSDSVAPPEVISKDITDGGATGTG
jgi:hypothetical protein